MIDPTGQDCVYTQNVNDDGTVTVEQGDCSQDNGIYVPGTIDTNSFNLTQTDNGYSLSFGYNSYDTGGFSLFSTNLPGMSNFDMGGFGFGSPNYAAQLFSQVYNSTQAITNPRNIAAFYGASAAAGALGLAGATYGPQLATALETYGPQALGTLNQTLDQLLVLGRSIALNPQYVEAASDFLQGYTPGAIPATLAGYAGGIANWAWTNRSPILQGFEETYQEIRGSVPH